MRSIIAGMILLMVASVAHAGYGAGDPRLAKLYSTFMAPCCYGGDLTNHSSGTADELRQRIAAMVKEGQTDEQIKAALVAEYGDKILTVPDGSAHTWLFSAPGFFVALGLLIVVWVLRRMRKAPVTPAEAAGSSG